MRGISEKEHERLIKAMTHLQKQLEKVDNKELAHKIGSSRNDLDKVYAQYEDSLSRLGLIVGQYYKTFQKSHENYIEGTRVQQKMQKKTLT